MNRIVKTRQAGLLSAALGVVILAAYWPILRAQFIGLDDPIYVTGNAHVLHGLSGGNLAWAFRTDAAANWHPLTWLSHMLDAQLFGLDPMGHHLTSLLFHIANALLIFLLFLEWTGALWRSLFVAVLFALHPLHVESVAWVAERKDVLSAFFFLLTLWAYGRYARPSGEAQGRGSASERDTGGKQLPAVADSQEATARSRERPPVETAPGRAGHPWAFYLLALVFFALGLMSKPMLVTLPCVLLLLDFWPLERWPLPSLSPRLWRLLLEKVPFFLLAAASSAVTWVAQDKGHATTAVLPMGPRLANAVASYWQYLGKTLWPVDLAVYYPHPDTRYPVSHQWPGWAIALAALALMGISLWVLRRSRRTPWLAVGWFWYLGTLVPVIGIVQVGGQGMADRYTYIPLIGVFLCVVWAVGALLAARPSALTAVALSTVLAIAGCLALTQRQLRFWQSDFALFSHALEVTTENVVAEVQVGVGCLERGRPEEAARHFRAAIQAAPANVRGYHGLGLALMAEGQLDQAVGMFQQALSLAPWDEQAHHDLGLTLWALGRRDEAQAQYAEALRLRPDFAEAHLSMGAALSARGDLEGAAAEFARALQFHPGDGNAYARLAELRLKQGRLAEAEAVFRQWVESSPANAQARINLGGVLWRLGRMGDALAQYAQAAELAPGLPLAHFDFATALSAQGRLPDAANQFAEAVRLKPDYLEALTGLGRALIGLGQFDQATQPFAQAARLCPTNSDLHLYWGTALMLAGKTNAATEPFAAALRLEPDLVRKTIASGRVLAAQGQTNAAQARFNTALWLRPGDPDAHEGLGLLLKQQGKAEEADAHLREAARLRGLNDPPPR